jgi:hypothetical protein
MGAEKRPRRRLAGKTKGASWEACAKTYLYISRITSPEGNYDMFSGFIFEIMHLTQG